MSPLLSLTGAFVGIVVLILLPRRPWVRLPPLSAPLLFAAAENNGVSPNEKAG